MFCLSSCAVNYCALFMSEISHVMSIIVDNNKTRDVQQQAVLHFTHPKSHNYLSVVFSIDGND